MFPVHDFFKGHDLFFQSWSSSFLFFIIKRKKIKEKHRKSMKIDKILDSSLGKMKTKDPVKKTFWTFIFVQKKIVGQRNF